jgi:hypothetical protein
MDSMFVVSRQPQVVLVNADSLLMFKKNVQILCLEFLWNLEIAMPGNVVSGKLNPGSSWDIAFYGGAHVGCSVVREGAHLVLVYFNDAHDVIPLDGDIIGSAVFNDDLAILVAVNYDQ